MEKKNEDNLCCYFALSLVKKDIDFIPFLDRGSSSKEDEQSSKAWCQTLGC